MTDLAVTIQVSAKITTVTNQVVVTTTALLWEIVTHTGTAWAVTIQVFAWSTTIISTILTNARLAMIATNTGTELTATSTDTAMQTMIWMVILSKIDDHHYELKS